MKPLTYYQAQCLTEQHRFTAESFGDACPDDWEHICNELNGLLRKFIYVADCADHSIINSYCNDLWEWYFENWNAEYETLYNDLEYIPLIRLGY